MITCGPDEVLAWLAAAMQERHQKLGDFGVFDALGFDVVKKFGNKQLVKQSFVGDPQEARLKVSFFGPF